MLPVTGTKDNSDRPAGPWNPTLNLTGKSSGQPEKTIQTSIRKAVFERKSPGRSEDFKTSKGFWQ